MKFCKRHAAKLVVNSSTCSAWEYALHDKDMDVAVIDLTGNHPSHGFAMNEKCKLFAYVVSGKGKLVIKDHPPILLDVGDMVLIEPGDLYRWEGTMTLLMPAAPAWYKEQYKVIDG